MSILSRNNFVGAQRVDLEDLEAMLGALRTDSKLWTKEFLSNSNYIIKGFAVSGLGLTSATIEMDNATLLFANNATDFSYFIAENSPTDLTISASALIDSARNFVELELYNVTSTPLTKAFWDDEANGGQGQEFNQQVNTVVDLRVRPVVNQSGFTGFADRVPLAIIDVSRAGLITGIFDQRPLFFRLGTPVDPSSTYSWASQTEPSYTLGLTGVSGSFLLGEVVTIDGSITATVSIAGTSTISIRLPSSLSFGAGDSITSASGSGTISTVLESFVGADKSINNFKNMLSALMTEIKAIKGSAFWYTAVGPTVSGLGSLINSQLVGVTSGARYSWSGTELSITDNSGTPANADVLAKLRVFGSGLELNLTRQDSTGGSTTIPISDGQVMYIELPTGVNRTYSNTGSGSTNYKVVAQNSFVVSDNNYWIGFREGGLLYVRGYGQLATGEEAEISDPITTQILTFMGAVNEADFDPNYTSTNIVTQGSSLVNGISQLDDSLGLLSSSSNQDRNLKLIDGGTWNLDQTYTLSWNDAAFIQIPGLQITVNEILASSVSLPTDGDVAYITVKRTTGASTRVVSVSPINSLVATADTFIIARRIDTEVFIDDSFSLRVGEHLEIDGAFKEVTRRTNHLRVYAHETLDDQVRINSSTISQGQGYPYFTTWGRHINGRFMSFTGAVVDFNSGVITTEDGSTALGNNFTPFSITGGNYYWYALSLVGSTINSLNEQVCVVHVDKATADNPIDVAAPRAMITGAIPIAHIQVLHTGGDAEVVRIENCQNNLDGNTLYHDTAGIKRGNYSSPGNFIEEQYIHSISLLASQTNTVISDFTVAHATYHGLEITFQVTEATSGDVSIGTLRVSTDGTNVGVNTVSADTSPTGVTFGAAISGANLQVTYSSGTNAATMRADVKRFKA